MGIIEQLRKPAAKVAVFVLILGIIFSAYAWCSSGYNNSGLLMNLGGTLMAVGVTLLSSSIIFDWYETHNKIKKLGVADIRPTIPPEGRRKRDEEFLEALKESKKEVILVGSSLGGAFVNNFDEILQILFERPAILRNVKVEVFLLHPESIYLEKRNKEELDGGEIEGQVVRRRLKNSLENLKHVLKKVRENGFPKENFQLYLYDATPISFYKIDEKIYVTTYLPFIPNKYCPQIVLEEGGELTERYKVAFKELRKNCKKCDLDELEKLVEILESKEYRKRGD